ncbi:alpha-L-rhamnosidase [Lactobacillus colini]|uniref:alpha-L-rhamnosidase n=1 Tax=Lactobacillus colini TaxID=1819254 RepID=A0ABS4MBU2_9LACO|nr:family 78 glycoside hydrolase catalytic domain [Lactobacillus colini]MBP2057147.1 alpha-L-rhamnosidase [Lactobacillus colini]
MSIKRNWQAKWITAKTAKVNDEPEFSLAEMFSGATIQQEAPDKRLKPPVVFKKIIKLTKKVKHAALNITAHGIYIGYINGQLISDAIFAPDYTSYKSFLQYQNYDVTKFLKLGDNILYFIVADGWYAGRISVQGGSNQFGNQLALLAELDIKYIDGTSKIIGTNSDFSVGSDKHRYADIDIGERQDLRYPDLINNDQLFNDNAIKIDESYDNLVLQEGPQVKHQEMLNPVKIWQESNSLIIDFGQVIAGRIRLKASFPKNKLIKIEHAEVLDENGKFFKNIVGRNKNQEDYVIGNGEVATFEPDFTFHGFRYAKITGLKEDNIKSIIAFAIYSDFKRTGWISTSNPKVNSLLQNILWSQRGNMLSIPTDCPQRERVGWTGDMQVFAGASTFYYDTYEFIRRWLKNVRADQRENGEILDYSPAPKDFFKSVEFTGSLSSAGWGDAIILIPYILYQKYGKKEILQENFTAMERWHNFAVKSAASNKKDNTKYLWDTKFHYGDWMFPSLMMKNPDPMKTAKLTKNIVATSFLAHTSELLGEIAEILGADGQKYFDYAKKVKEAFNEYYVKDGQLTSDFQGCYVIAIAFKMVSGQVKKRLFNRLVELIHQNDDRLDTGFLATPYLLDVLTENGQENLAKKIFLNEDCPSWLYEVVHGATTIWESWACIQPDGKVGTFSFNHYAMGVVINWIIEKVIGLGNLKPGFKQIEINPKIKVLPDFKFEYQTVSGNIMINLKDNIYTCQIPQGIKAELVVSDTEQFARSYPNVKKISKNKFLVGSGKYSFI